MTSDGVVYHANLLIVFKKVLNSNYVALLYESLYGTFDILEEYCTLCSTTLYELNYRPTTTLVYRVEIRTGRRCGEDVILSQLKRIESLTFKVQSIGASYTATVIDLYTDKPGPIIKTALPPNCPKESMEKYITISSHYFCKAVLVDRERALLIGTKNVTYKNRLRPFTYVCEDELMIFSNALGHFNTNGYAQCCAYVYLHLLIVGTWALITNVIHC